MRRESVFKITVIFISSFLIFALTCAGLFAAEMGFVNGKVADKKSKSPLPGITITVEGKDAIGFTDDKGNYSLTLPEGTYTIRAELLGYKTAEAKKVVVEAGETNNVNFALEEFEAIKGEEVVVTGERTGVPLSKTTASVSVVSSQQAKDLASSGNASDMLAYTPGVQMEGGGSGASKTIKIRGATIAPPKVTTAGILMLVDGVPMNDPISGYASLYMIPSENIERIEVLKGASSAQYGGQAAAGVINIITKKGKKEPRTSFDMSFGTYQSRANAEDEYTQNYSFSHSWGNDWIDYNLSGSYGVTTGFTTAETAKVGKVFIEFGKAYPDNKVYDRHGIKHLPNGSLIYSSGGPKYFGKDLNILMDAGSDMDAMERYSFNLSLGIKLFKNNTLRINPGYSYLQFFVPFTPDMNPFKRSDDVFLQMFLNVINKRDYINFLDEWKITPKLTYKLRGVVQKSTEGGIFIPVLDYVDEPLEREALGFKDGFAGGDGKSPFLPTPGTTIGRSWTMANDFSYDFDILDGNTLSVGHEYQWMKLDAPLSKNGGSQLYTKDILYRKSSSLFFQSLQKAGKLSVSLGGRWDQMTTFINDREDEFSPRLGLNYEISPGTSLRASVGRARRFIEFARTNGLGQSNGVLFGNPKIGPEINWSWELGFKFLAKYLGGDIAYFYNDYSDFETPVPLNIGAIPAEIAGDSANARARRQYMEMYNYVRKYYPFKMPTPEEGLTATKYMQQWLGASVPAGVATENANAGMFANGTKVVYQGFDTSVELNPLKDLNINLSYLFTRATVGNQNPFDFSQGKKQSVLLSSTSKGLGPAFHGGDRLIYIPTHVFKISSNYTLPFGLRVIASGRYKSEATTITRTAVGGTFNMPKHWIFDLKFVQPFFNNKFKLSFSIENVFSRKYYAESVIPSNVARYDLGISYSF